MMLRGASKVCTDLCASSFQKTHLNLSQIERGLPLQDLSPTTFSLSRSLTGRLLQASDSLYDGVGFTLIKGVDAQNYTTKENIIIQSGVTSYFGSMRGFNGPSDMNVLGT